MKIQTLAKAILNQFGWEAIQLDPLEKKIDQAVVVIAPHTSTWDLFVGLAVNLALENRVNWIGKKEIFQFPFSHILKALGGIPLDREHCSNTVLAIVKEFRKRPKFLFAISPEGTRASSDYWRSGFYYIALKAKVPIILGFIDYQKRQGGLGKVLHPTGDIEADLAYIREFYDEIMARHPERFAPVVFRLAPKDDFWAMEEATLPT